jgi:virulence factor Mce-like protein
MRTSRLAANLLAVAAVSAVLILYAFSSLLAGAVIDDSYPIEVVLAESGGLLGAQEVTVSGRVVGTVGDVWLEGEGVVARLDIHKGQTVPSDADVVVLRRSPIGEQAIDFRPRRADAPPVQEGERIAALNAVTPVPVQRLLTKADAVLGPVDGERAGVLVAELADAVRGRGDDIRGLVQDGARLSEALAANEADLERFFAHSATVNEALSRSRGALARSIGQMADASRALVDMRADFEGLLNEAPRVLGQVEKLVGDNQANLSCALKDLGNLNEFLGRPEQMANTEEALRKNQWFFRGAEYGAPLDPWGRVWTRIKFLPPQPEQPDSYLPDKRPIPDILPGAACQSSLGAGVGAPTQAGYQQTTVEARFVPAGQPVAVTVAGLGLGMPRLTAADADGRRVAESVGLLLALVGSMVAVRAMGRALRKGRA